MPDESAIAHMEPAVRAQLETQRARVAAALIAACDAELGTISEIAPRVADAIRYAALGGGKRLRGILFLAAYDASGGSADGAPLAAAIELVHAYSLVHDDLPCMDDDDVRRGRPTVHRAFDGITATIAGIAMVPFAARVASRGAAAMGAAPATRGAIVSTLMRASGAGGMIGGQLLDLEGEGKLHGLVDLERIHTAKTGALIAAAAELGAIAASATERVARALRRYGEAIGLAFQIADDVLDVTATTDVLGKTAGRDVALRKSTYPSLLGVEGARARAVALVNDALDALHDAGVHTPVLEHIARFVVDRSS